VRPYFSRGERNPRSCAHAQLDLPHKGLFERAFVLIPLAEIAPDLKVSGRSIAKAAALFSGEPIEKRNGTLLDQVQKRTIPSKNGTQLAGGVKYEMTS
jgi:hypothetical protein